MLTIIAENWWLFLIAFLIGIATAWWVWAQYDAEVEAPSLDTDISPKLAEPLPKVEAAPLMDTAVAAPVAKPKAKAKPKPKAAAPAAKKAAAKPAVKKTEAKPAAKKAAAKPAAKKAAAKPKAEPKPKVAATPAAKKVAAKPAAKPAAKKAAPKKAAAKPVIPDNLELLKGVGPKLNGMLKDLGVTSFDQVANWSASDIREIDSKLGAFAGRITRDNWTDQAKLLLKGDIATFEKKYGALGSEITKG